MKQAGATEISSKILKYSLQRNYAWSTFNSNFGACTEEFQGIWSHSITYDIFYTLQSFRSLSQNERFFQNVCNSNKCLILYHHLLIPSNFSVFDSENTWSHSIWELSYMIHARFTKMLSNSFNCVLTQNKQLKEESKKKSFWALTKLLQRKQTTPKLWMLL